MNTFTKFLASVVLVIAVGTASGQVHTWGGATGNWTTAANWVSGMAPIPGTSAILIFGSSGSYTSTNNYTGIPAFYANGISVENNSGSVVLNSPATLPNALPVRPGHSTGITLNFQGAGDKNMLIPLNLSRDQINVTTIAPGTGNVTLGSNTSDIGSFLIGTGTQHIINNSVFIVNIGNIQEHFQGTLVLEGLFRASRTGGNLFSEQAVISLASGTSVLDFNNNGEDMGAIAGSGTVIHGTAGLSFRARTSAFFEGSFQGSGNIIARAGRSGGEVTTWAGLSTTTGNISVEAGEFILTNLGAVPNTIGSYSLTNGATIRLNNQSIVVANRLSDSAAFSLGGTLRLEGKSATTVSETIGAVTVNNTGGSILETVIFSGGTTTLTLSSLARGGRGSIVDFRGDGNFQITTPPTLINGIIGGYATYGTDWATMSGTNVVPLTTYQTSNNPAVWAATDNVNVLVALSGPTGSRTINSLRTDGVNIDLGGGTLVLNSNGLMALGTATISNGTIRGGTATNPELAVTVSNVFSTLTLTANIDNTSTQSVVKAGEGRLELSGANTYTGGTRVYGGILEATTLASLGANTSGNAVTVSNATLRLSGDFSTNARALNFNGANATIEVTGSNIALFNTIADNQDSGGFFKRGTGTLIGNAGGLNGNISVQQGTFRASGGAFGTAGDAVDNQTILTIASGAIFDDSFGDGEDLGFLAGNGEFRMRGDLAVGLRMMSDPATNYNTNFGGIITTYVSGVPSTLTAGVRYGNETAVTGHGGVITLSGLSTYSGDTTITYGEVRVAADVLPGQPGPFGNPSPSLQTIVIGNSTISSRTNAALYLQGAVTFGRDILVRDSSTPGQAYGVVTIGADLPGTSNYNGNITLDRSIELVVKNGATTNFAGLISGLGGIVKLGANSAFLTRPAGNTYSGTTIVTEGQLVALNAFGSATGSGNVFINGTGTLAGTGVVAPTVGNSVVVGFNGRIRGDFGVGTGTLFLGGNSRLLNNSNFDVQLNAPTPVILGNSKINIGSNTMNFQIGIGESFDITLLDDSNLAVNTPYTIVIAESSMPNRFLKNGIPYDSVLNPFIHNVDYFLISGSGTQIYSPVNLFVDSSNNLVLSFTPIPEPSMLGLMGLIGVCAIARRWKYLLH